MVKLDGFVESIMGTPLSDEEMKARMKKATNSCKRYNARLRKRAKPKEELLIPVDCLVERVTGYTHEVSHTPHSEVRYGGSSPSYKTGMFLSLELSVQTGTPIETIKFPGWPPIEKGDKIRAYIFAGTEEHEKPLGSISEIIDASVRLHKPASHWVQREFTETEEVQKIEKLRNNKVVATYINS